MKPILFAFFFVLLISCNSNTILKKPKNLIPKEQMAAILTDSYIAQKAKYTENLNEERDVNYHAFIYNKYNTDSTTFHQSLKYYVSNIKQHEEILKMVEAKLKSKLEQVEKERKIEEEKARKEKVKDSIH